MFDVRCLALTVQRHTAAEKRMVELAHLAGCKCKEEATAVIVLGQQADYCPCGLLKHQGMCADAAIVARGGLVPRWKP